MIIMLKLSTTVLLFAIGVFRTSLCVRAHHSEVQDRVIEALTNEWIENMKSIPEPYQSWAIEKIKDAKAKDWKSIGDYYVELLNISQQVIGKSESELALSKREISGISSEETFDYRPQPYEKIALLNVAESAKDQTVQKILKQKFEEAFKMKWNNYNELIDYCYALYSKLTGEELLRNKVTDDIYKDWN